MMPLTPGSEVTAGDAAHGRLPAHTMAVTRRLPETGRVGTPDLSEIGRLAALARRQRRELDELRAEIAARSVIERATGILMERLGCPADEATQQLAHLAAEAGARLVGIAPDIAAARPRDPGLAGAPPHARAQAGLVGAATAAAPEAARLAAA